MSHSPKPLPFPLAAYKTRDGTYLCDSAHVQPCFTIMQRHCRCANHSPSKQSFLTLQTTAFLSKAFWQKSATLIAASPTVAPPLGVCALMDLMLHPPSLCLQPRTLMCCLARNSLVKLGQRAKVRKVWGAEQLQLQEAWGTRRGWRVLWRCGACCFQHPECHMRAVWCLPIDHAITALCSHCLPASTPPTFVPLSPSQGQCDCRGPIVPCTSPGTTPPERKPRPSQLNLVLQSQPKTQTEAEALA